MRREAEILLCAIAALHLAIFAWVLAGSAILLPFMDMFDWAANFQRFGWSWDGLWLPHNEHHLLFSRVLTAISYGWAGGLWPFLVADTLCLLGIGTILAAACWRAGGWLAALLALLVVGTSANAVDASVPINGLYAQAVLFVVLALRLMAAEGSGPRGDWADWRRGLGVLAGIAAGLGNAVGLAVWPVLVVSAWRHGGRGWAFFTLLAGTQTLRLLTRDLPQSLHGLPALADWPGEIATRGLYLLHFLALPASRAPALALPSLLLGAALLGAAVWLIWRWIAQPPGNLAERLAPGLAAFTLLAGLLAALGRAEEGGVPVRYALLVTPLHAALIMAAGAGLARRWQTSTTWQRLVPAGAACLLLLQWLGGQAAVRQAGYIRTDIQDFAEGLRRPEMHASVYPDFAAAARVMRELGEGL